MIEEFLEVIWGDDPRVGELRFIHRDGRTVQFFHDNCTGLEPILREAWSREATGDYDVYYGVLQRTKFAGTNDACVPTTHVLWADVDAKRTSGKWAALAGIRMAKQQPSIIVDSGHGYHCYWLLRDEVPFEQAQNAMKALAREVHGDSVYDAARILRVPGTTNRKDPANPVPVRLVFWDVERKYRISDFEQDYPKPQVLTTSMWDRAIGELLTGGEGALTLPTWLEDLIAESTPKGGRSEACFKVALWLVRFHLPDVDIEDIFRGHPDGIGEKYHELGAQGPRWMKRTIKAARAAA